MDKGTDPAQSRRSDWILQGCRPLLNAQATSIIETIIVGALLLRILAMCGISKLEDGLHDRF